MERKEFNVIDTAGNAVRGASVLIKTYPAGVVATLYADDEITPMANPLTTDITGQCFAKAANGHYSKTVSKTGITTETTNDIIFFDYDDADASNLGFDYSLSYAVGTIGKWLKDLALAVGSTFIGFASYGSSKPTITIRDQLRGNGQTAPDARGFWKDIAGGVNLHLFRDRVFIGGATDNDGKLTNTVKDWLETERVSTTNNANVAILSTIGQTALLAGSRTSDFSTAGSEGCIGGNFWAINDNASQVQTAYAIYAEARRKAGAGTTHAFEFDIVNQGSIVDVLPTDMFGTGATPGLWAASGGGVGGAADASVAIAIINNGAKFRKGIVFHSTALTSNEAIAFARQHTLTWYSDAGNLRAKIRSDAQADSFAVVFEDGRLSIKNIAETELFAFLTAGKIELKAANAGIEIGDTGSANSPVIDFHSSGNNIDYDGRILCTNGTGSSGNGIMQYFGLRHLFSGDIETTTAGKGLRIKEGSNARMGASVLVGGTVAVSNTSVTANTKIFLSRSTTGGTTGDLSYTISAGASFTINSSSGTDTSTINWILVEPA